MDDGGDDDDDDDVVRIVQADEFNFSGELTRILGAVRLFSYCGPVAGKCALVAVPIK